VSFIFTNKSRRWTHHNILDISAGNVLMEVEDHSIIAAFIKAEQDHPSPRKEVDGYAIYASRSFDLPKSIGEPVLSDFG
jgi:serine/threonine-protein kinase SRPK3